MKKVIVLVNFLLLSLISTLSCKNDDEVSVKCVKASYLGKTNSPCGGEDLIVILENKEAITSLYPHLDQNSELKITTNLPEELETGEEFYFVPVKAASRICDAFYIPLPEIEVVSASVTGCR
jgi:hypothetical protein